MILRIVVVALLILSPAAALAQCVSGTVTSELQTTGPFAGLYKYTVDLTWDTPQGLSNITMDCNFGLCPDFICSQTFAFESIAGTSDGEPAPCTVDYVGEFNCNGNPSIGWTDPIIKWDAVYSGGCEPGNTGTGTFCFYTNMGPSPNQETPLFLIKNGQQVCQGMLVGDCPTGCPVPVQHKTLGGLKADYD